MSGNQKQAIEEMAKIITSADPYVNCKGQSCLTCEFNDIEKNCYSAKAIYNAGYRKQSAVIDEFAKRLKEKMDDLSRVEYNGYTYFVVGKAFIDKIAEEMKGGE